MSICPEPVLRYHRLKLSKVLVVEGYGLVPKNRLN